MPEAYDRSQIKSKLGWSNSFNPNAAFPLDARQYFGSYAEAEAAAATAVAVGSTESAYHYGMQLFVFDGNNAGAYLIQGDGSLKELGTTEGSTTPAEIKWVGENAKVNFHVLTRAAYNALATKEAGTLYFLSDEHAIYRGTENYSDEIDIVTTLPAVADAVPRKVYIEASTMAIKATIDNINWIVASPGYLTDDANWADAASDKLATIGLIKKALSEATGVDFTLSFNAETGVISAGEGEGKSVALTGVAHSPTYAADTMTITIPVYGQDDLVIVIPKDKYLTGGQYNEATGDIEFTIEGVAEPIKVPASAIVKQLEAANEGKNVQITIADGKISATVVIDPAADNLLIDDGNGLRVKPDDSRMPALTGTAEDAGKILIVGADGKTAAIATLKLSDLGGGSVSGAVENNLTSFGPDGSLKDSGKTVGGATLAETPDADTVATEAAVRAAIHNALKWESI